MSESSCIQSPRLVTHTKQQDLSIDETNLRTIRSQQTAYEDALIRFKHYVPKSTFIEIDKLRASPNLKIKKGKDFLYFGEMQERKRNGMGIILHDNGKIYEGQWSNDEKQGQGYEIFTSKNQYFGQYSKGKPHGLGKYQWNNGQVYEGEWKEGLRHGSGTWKGTDNTSYVGEWRQGKPQGFGVLIWAQGDRYEGYFKQNLKHGQGYERYSSGDLYRGNFQFGKKQGYGQYFWQNGSYYKGTFVNGLRQGNGVWHSQAGDTYEGQYKNGKKDGYGIYKWFDGTVYKGNFKEDLREGYGQMLWKDGSCYKGGWRKNVENGVGEIFSKGIMKKCKLVNNVITELENQQDQWGSRVKKQTRYGQKLFNKQIRDNVRYRATQNTPQGFKKAHHTIEGKKRIKTQDTNRTQWRSLAEHPKHKNKFEVSNFKINASRLKQTQKFKFSKEVKSITQYRSSSQKNHIPHSSFLPHQMHNRRIRTSNDDYQKEQKEDRLSEIVEKPYNLTKLMHRFKLVRSVQQHH